jgi:acetoacetyl-CoA reductase
MITLKDKVAIVTGAAQGIGKGIALELARNGANVALWDVSRDAVEAAAAELRGQGLRATGYVVDVSSSSAVDGGFSQVSEVLGPVDVLVNNAGITRDAVLHRMRPEQWGEVIATNLTSCFNMCRVVIDGMRERSFGRIVNIGSINGQAGQYGQVNYAAAKSGIHGFTKALAQEGAAKGITVNAIAPGYIDTDMVRAVPANVLEKIVARVPVGRLGAASEIARGVLFLVSDEGAFITGSTLSINGGQHMY